MSDARPDEGPDSAAVLESMTLLATLSTAAEVRDAVQDRRTGRDPAAQAPSDVATVRLHEARRTLMDLLMQLVLGQVPLERQEKHALGHAVRHFDLLMKVRRAKRLAKTMHQHLLSLYPNVSEELVEEARCVRDALEGLTDDAGDGAAPLPDVVERGLALVVWVRHEV
ncbi:MAG: hypothetical protein R6T83_01120 [Salinibacter sp.]